MFNNFFSENRAVYEKMRKNIVESDRRQTIICCMLETLAHNIQSNLVIAFLLQEWLHEHT